jgi:dihydrofolate reductase
MGYLNLMNEIDAIVMGRTTFETVCGFEGKWPYKKQVFVLSNSLKEIPEKLNGKITLLNRNPKKVLDEVHKRGFYKLYIDGGKTLQDFLKENLIDELRITTIPILLGGGFPLFDTLPKSIEFSH